MQIPNRHEATTDVITDDFGAPSNMQTLIDIMNPWTDLIDDS